VLEREHVRGCSIVEVDERPDAASFADDGKLPLSSLLRRRNAGRACDTASRARLVFRLLAHVPAR
jgi:hypothetical protein